MTRLIDADALIEDISKEINKKTKVILLADYNDYYCSGMRNAIKLVKRLPTIDPVKHGHWIDTGRADYYLNKEYRCSCCNSVDYLCSPYCYNCGTKMDDEPKEE